jgi:hypothetical protein
VARAVKLAALPTRAGPDSLELWQAAVLAELRAIRAALEPDRRPAQTRDDDALMLALATAVADRAFSAREVWQHALLVDRELRAALGTVSNARGLGKLFRQLEGRQLAGVRLARIGVDRDGVIWRVSRV